MVIDEAEKVPGQVRVRASAARAGRLLTLAAAWPQRTWAVEGARGMGNLLSWQLPAAGEKVLDVQPRLGARVRLLSTGNTSKNDPGDARPVAIAALRSPAPVPVRPDDHAAVLKVWSKRHRDLSRSRNQVVCRLHAVLRPDPRRGQQADQRRRSCPGAGAGRAVRRRRQAAMSWPPGFLAGLRRIDAQLRETGKKLATAVRASGTTLTEVFGIGPAIAVTAIGDVRDISRFPSRNHFAACNGTAPVEVSSGNRVTCRLSLRGGRRLNHATHMAAVTQIRYRHSDGRACYDKKIAEGKTPEEALRALKRKISDAICKHMKADATRATSSSQGPGRAPGERL